MTAQKNSPNLPKSKVVGFQIIISNQYILPINYLEGSSISLYIPILHKKIKSISQI